VKLCESDFGAVPVHALREPSSGMELPLLRSGVDDICTLVFTSGSTATPKAVALTHGNIHAASQAKLKVVGYSVRDVYMHAAPLCHIGGLSSAHAALSAAAVHVFPTGSAFRAGEAIRLVRKHRVTAFIAVPTMLHDLLRTLDEGDSQPLLGVTKLLVGGGAASHSLLERTVTRLVPKAHVIGTYALSEACSSCAFRTLAVDGAMTAPPPALDRAAAAVVTGGVCCGTPAPACTLRISDDGEICVAGPQVMARYWGDAAGTAAALVHDQTTTGRLWLHTGDLGRLDTSGRLWLFGRAADVIKSGGENIHAAEVETALCSHSAVATAVVVPVTHDRWGTAVTACIMLKPAYSWHGPCVPVPSSRAMVESRSAEGAALTPSALCAHVTSHSVGLARFKAPRLIAAWTGNAALPMGATGKVDKRAIAAVMSALVRATPTAWLDATYVRSRL
jgi:o-succinylbenzoate---CoA ligase